MIDLTSVLGSGFELYKFLSQKSRAKNATRSLVIREILHNLKILEHRNKEGISVRALIQKLCNQEIVSAMKSGYNFNKLAKGQVIEKELAEQNPYSKRYKGWDADRLIKNIDLKIQNLMDIVDIYPEIEKANLNITSRLNNLNLIILLLVILIRKDS